MVIFGVVVLVKNLITPFRRCSKPRPRDDFGQPPLKVSFSARPSNAYAQVFVCPRVWTAFWWHETLSIPFVE
jgi:hypothetical protein